MENIEDRRLIVGGDDESSWTDADSMHSNPRASNILQLRTIAHELELIRANVQIMLDRVLSALQTNDAIANESRKIDDGE